MPDAFRSLLLMAEIKRDQTGGGGGGSRYLCRQDTSVRLSMQIAALEKTANHQVY
jgi:hypothetical protein